MVSSSISAPAPLPLPPWLFHTEKNPTQNNARICVTIDKRDGDERTPTACNFLFSLQIVTQASTQYDQTMTTLVQSTNRPWPITTALEDEESSAPSEDKSRFLTKKNLTAVAVAFSLGLIAGGILLHMFKRCVDFRNRRSRKSPKRK